MYARWLIEGNPKVLLFDTGSAYHRLDEWKGDLWNAAGIPTPSHDTETNDAVVFGYLVAWFLGEYVHHEQSRAIIAHFHEWQVGVAIPLIRKRRLDLVTIFTVRRLPPHLRPFSTLKRTHRRTPPSWVATSVLARLTFITPSSPSTSTMRPVSAVSTIATASSAPPRIPRMSSPRRPISPLGKLSICSSVNLMGSCPTVST